MALDKSLIASAKKMDKRAIGKLLSAVESDLSRLGDLGLKKKRSLVLGVTGPPGAGKSTFLDQLIRHLRGQKKTVAVVAVDPTSPFSGGSILGDRIRMTSAGLDDGVFIRSYASKESLGGLSKAARGGLEVFEWLGFDVVLLETVGMGQLGADVRQAAHTTVVVLVPGYGDTIQFMKAGIIELADLFVVNKADMPGARELFLQVQNELHQLPASGGWAVPVALVNSLTGQGVTDFWALVQKHGGWLDTSGQRETVEGDRRLSLTRLFLNEAWETRREALLNGPAAPLTAAVAAGKTTPYDGAGELLKKLFPVG